MPVTFEIDAERRVVITIVTGRVLPAEMFAYQDALAADPRFSPTYDSLTDFSGAEPFSGSAADIRALSERSPFAAGSRRAYVATSDLHFGLSRMAQVYAEHKGVIIEVFRDRDAALRWLGT